MLEAIKSVENKLSSSAEMFTNSTSGSKNKWKQFWHRLKYAANKEEIETLMQWVDRTTQQVTLVQQNLSRYGITFQAFRLLTASVSFNLNKATY